MEGKDDQARGQDSAEVGEVIYHEGTDDPGPDITERDVDALGRKSPLPPATRPDTTAPETPDLPRTIFGGKSGKGNVTFGGDQERQQADRLAQQMTRSIENQLQSASEHVHHIGWVETDPPSTNDNELTIKSFKLILSNGKTYTLEGPLITMKIEN